MADSKLHHLIRKQKIEKKFGMYSLDRNEQ